MAASPPRRLLVTGASGFVGSHLVPLLRTAYPSAQVVTDRVDITDRGAVFAVVQELQPDACIHLAAVATIAAAVQDADRAWHVNLHGTLNVANAVLAHTATALALQDGPRKSVVSVNKQIARKTLVTVNRQIAYNLGIPLSDALLQDARLIN